MRDTADSSWGCRRYDERHGRKSTTPLQADQSPFRQRPSGQAWVILPMPSDKRGTNGTFQRWPQPAPSLFCRQGPNMLSSRSKGSAPVVRHALAGLLTIVVLIVIPGSALADAADAHIP